MKRLLWLAFFAYVAWFGWNHRDALHAGPHLDAVVENSSGHPVQRIRLTLGSETQVRETLAPGEKVTLTFRSSFKGVFKLVWQWADAPGEKVWTGGVADDETAPLDHRLQIQPGGNVFWASEVPQPKSK